MLLTDENLRDEKVAQKLCSPEFELGFLPAKPKEFLSFFLHGAIKKVAPCCVEGNEQEGRSA